MHQPLSARASTVFHSDAHGVAALESSFNSDVRIEPHTHATGYVSVTLAGSVADTLADRSVDAAPGYICWVPPDTPHANRFGPTGARCLLIEAARAALVELAALGCPAPQSWSAIGGRLACRGMALRTMLLAGIATSLDVEEFLSHILATRPVNASQRSQPPAWLRRTRGWLDADFVDPPSLAALAAEAGVHPMHLIRAFRRFGGCSPGQYVQTRRIVLACELLAQADLPLSRLARRLGFNDQSHFTRAFRTRTGITPAAYRAVAAAGRTGATAPPAGLSPSADP